MRPVLLLVALALALPGCLAPLQQLAAPPGADEPMRFDALRVDTTMGGFTAILFVDEHPNTTQFMRKLAAQDYYVGREFGRIIPGFVIQEVDRTGGTTDQTERVPLEAGTSVQFSAGAIGIARDADPDSGGSEFFVMDFPHSGLYGNYTAFAQVVEGLDVVHAIARVPAVKTGPVGGVVGAPPDSPVYFGVHDRVPVEPVQITKVELLTIELPAEVAARYPLRLAPTLTTDTYRATLEWPASLDVNVTSTLTWYVAGRDASQQGQLRDPPQPDLTGATVRIEGPHAETQRPMEDVATPGILRFTWAPQMPGNYTIHLEKDGQELAASEVRVPDAFVPLLAREASAP